MSLMSVVLVLVIVGVLLGLVNRYVPMDGRIQTILNVVVVVAVVLWLLYGFGALSRSPGIRLFRMR
jgi:bacteriorhodopsin